MRCQKLRRYAIQISLLSLIGLSFSAHATHHALLFNDKAMEKILEVWPDFVETVNNQKRGIEDPGGRGLLVASPLLSHLNKLLREYPNADQFAAGFNKLVDDHYHRAGMTAFASRLDSPVHVAYFNYMVRNGLMPIRFAYSLDLARQPIPSEAAAGLYANVGPVWQTIEQGHPFLWLHGMSSEGDWDSPTRACLGDDLGPKPGASEELKKQVEIIEFCPDFTSDTVQSLIRGVRAGWRFAGVHAIGSHGVRLFVQKLEEQMKSNPHLLTLEYVRGIRHFFGHGDMLGAVPDVVESMKKYNLYMPINLRATLQREPPTIRQYYGEPGWEFMGPVKTLLDAGVKVVGESEIGEPTPETYLDVLDVYVNREVNEEGWPPSPDEKSQVYNPDERINRVIALKLFTYRAAEALHAESKIGSLEVGKFGDFVVIDNNYLEGPDNEIRNNKVVMTVQAGKVVYRDPNYEISVREGP